ncbi:HK97 gp10 family phage protein [Clostridium carboxidivorans]|uniref:HK97 gp10 family phage protein n=1 Tax=Clostridium carboxidivorans TaxID=217159 RepID=UPI00069E2206|nr:HK97 gp10 family phage protein [Clostridium carboxidivorans]
MGWETKGLDDFQKRVLEFVNNNWPEEKQNELMKLGKMYQREVKDIMNDENIIDTGRLINSITNNRVDKNTIEVGTNVDYALDVEEGHVQHKRFVPTSALKNGSGKKWKQLSINTTFESKINNYTYMNETQQLPVTDKRVKGFMLKEKFIPGKHMFKRGWIRFKPKAEQELKRWTDEMFKRICG